MESVRDEVEKRVRQEEEEKTVRKDEAEESERGQSKDYTSRFYFYSAASDSNCTM